VVFPKENRVTKTPNRPVFAIFSLRLKKQHKQPASLCCFPKGTDQNNQAGEPSQASPLTNRSGGVSPFPLLFCDLRARRRGHSLDAVVVRLRHSAAAVGERRCHSNAVPVPRRRHSDGGEHRRRYSAAVTQAAQS
jgi:hypothetical protein